ncbi:MAG: crossover junction endodeoxyribonuclease RuvC [Candidatus Pacebacteria bacterium]|nr:crossover junction endodeoxyribonuclease RuvC [Candidatus Paceibacterota bacterium]
MIILGIDPGTASTGYGVVKQTKNLKLKTKVCFECLDYGIIKTLPTQATGERLKKLNNELSRMIKKYKPEVLSIESLFFFKNLKTALPVSQAAGVILLTAAKNNIPAFSFTPMQVKMIIAGHGWAEKEKVQEKIKKILKLKEIPKPDDAADALAIALTYLLKKTS